VSWRLRCQFRTKRLASGQAQLSSLHPAGQQTVKQQKGRSKSTLFAVQLLIAGTRINHGMSRIFIKRNLFGKFRPATREQLND
jgi:hypothetical protein